jgi:hypothetical protein
MKIKIKKIIIQPYHLKTEVELNSETSLKVYELYLRQWKIPNIILLYSMTVVKSCTFSKIYGLAIISIGINLQSSFSIPMFCSLYIYIPIIFLLPEMMIVVATKDTLIWV